MSRRKAREQIFILLFEKYYTEDDISSIIDTAREYREEDFNKYAVETAPKIVEKIDELDKIIEANTKKWSKNRISKVALALLRLSIYEMKYVDDVPVGVSINEAVELAKKFGGEEDGAFVNGVLGAVAKNTEVKQESAL